MFFFSRWRQIMA